MGRPALRDVWGRYCSPAKPIAFHVDHQPYAGDLKTFPLQDALTIDIVIGAPPAGFPATPG